MRDNRARPQGAGHRRGAETQAGARALKSGVPDASFSIQYARRRIEFLRARKTAGHRRHPVSAHDEDEESKTDHVAGAKGFIVKPFQRNAAFRINSVSDRYGRISIASPSASMRNRVTRSPAVSLTATGIAKFELEFGAAPKYRTEIDPVMMFRISRRVVAYFLMFAGDSPLERR
jgi:hypothetical protein